MIFKRKHQKKSYVLFFSLLFLLIILILNYNKEKMREELFNVLDTINSIESGVSGLPGLYGRSNMTQFGDTFKDVGMVVLKEFPEKVLNSVPQIIKTSILGDDRIPKIDTLQLDIKHLNWQKLLSDRKAAIKKGLLIDRNELRDKQSNFEEIDI